MRSYIGVTGFMLADEVRACLAALPDVSDRLLMAGVLASSKTLYGLPNRWPGRFPHITDVADIFTDDPRALNLLHYSTDNPSALLSEMRYATELGGEHMHGFQLNVAWPDPQAVGRYKAEHPKSTIVLQVGSRAMREIGESPKRFVAAIIPYESTVDYLLLDPSGGYGKEFDVGKAWEYLEAVRESGLNIGLGVAGGLSPTTLGKIEPLAKEFPELSIDAEGRLRDPDGDTLVLRWAKRYIELAAYLFVGPCGYLPEGWDLRFRCALKAGHPGRKETEHMHFLSGVDEKVQLGGWPIEEVD